ncbi:MAG: hypothetical protein COB73_07035 [Flavobacteriaceae bacterium]|nr:MAG: hypothetical protein COB73_07035 [Flavobacteriaceae bacterium]
MKTKQFKLALLMLFVLLSVSLYSQDKFQISIPTYEPESVIDKITSDVKNDLKIVDIDEVEIIDIDDLAPQDAVQTILFIRNMLAVGAGFGFGENTFLWTLHAAYYLRLMIFANSALYVSLGAVYEGGDYDQYKSSLIDVQLKFLMFTAISKMMEIRLIYGPMFAYGFGSQKYDFEGYSSKDKLTQFTAALVVGLQLMIAAQWSLALHTNIFAYQSQTWKPEGGGGENKNNSTFGLINRNNIFAISLFFYLGGR